MQNPQIENPRKSLIATPTPMTYAEWLESGLSHRPTDEDIDRETHPLTRLGLSKKSN